MHDPLPAFPGYSLRRAANATGAELSSRLGELDLRQSDASALILVGANPGITSSAIGRALDIQRANMVPLLKRLEEAGLIARRPINGKAQGVELTEAGRERLSAAMAVITTFEAELIARVPQEHRAHLLPALAALWR